MQGSEKPTEVGTRKQITLLRAFPNQRVIGVRFLFPVYFINHVIVSEGTASTAQEQCQAILGGLHFLLPHTESHNWGRFKRLSAEEIEEEHKGTHEDLLVFTSFP